MIPPMMYDSEQRRVKFINMNGLMDDPMKVYKARQFMNVWTEHEKEIFKEKCVFICIFFPMSLSRCFFLNINNENTSFFPGLSNIRKILD